jgi:integrase
MALQMKERNMGISKKGSSWYYKFMLAGKLYCGTCDDVKSEAAALSFERRKREEIKSIRQHKTIGALVQDYKRELAGGRDILLQEVWPLFVAKPRKKPMGDKWQGMKESAWTDFLQYLKAKAPEIRQLAQIQERHASEYVAYLTQEGRWIKEFKMEDGRKFSTFSRKLSSRSLLFFIRTLKEICAFIGSEAGLVDNPFNKLATPKSSGELRDVFSLEDMKRLYVCEDAFCQPLFRLAIATAMRLGDICMLKRDKIDFGLSIIATKSHKTDVSLRIPFGKDVATYLSKLGAAAGESEMLLPEQAEMYLKNPSGVDYRINQCLEAMGFKTKRAVEGRTRKFAALSFHSIRHSVLYWLSVRGTPLSAVKAIAGHTQLMTTTRYIDHAKAEDARPALSCLVSDAENEDSALRAEVLRLVKIAPARMLKEMKQRLGGLV